MKQICVISFLFILMLFSCTKTLIGDEGKQDEDIYLNYQTKTDLELPFDEEWYVFVGGRTHQDGGHHFITRGTGQRYAYDLAIVIDGSSFSGDSSKNENHYCFGKRLNAPANGKIIAMENNIDDNYLSGIVNDNINDSNLAGNYILIDHFNGEYSLLAHLKKGSVLVNLGDIVAKGQEIGQAGNSGNSTGPHLHYHLQNSPNYLNGIGLPAQFRNYYEDDTLVDLGEPVKSQFIRKN
ncbi:M23 family metallopeptidase [uncultured Aquimarina sp.]|uniref:M23 family metallopeptidase n=1 Tax=uncultured Aquimarina sp. TaxID=575652 RepID=UPI00263955A9|nr:M23 family metallopeptidase [uncultured Aquimarina sp.]